MKNAVPPYVGRRDVLRRGAMALGALALPSVASAVHCRRLVIVRLDGGADGLGMVVPWRDPVYYRARPTIAVPPPGSGARAALDLDGTLGLHPRLAPLLPLFRTRVLDIAPACGLRRVTRSHLADGTVLDELLAGHGAIEAQPAGASARRVGEVLWDLAARVVDDVAPAVTLVRAHGWDHHAGQDGDAGPLAVALDELAQALSSFAGALGPALGCTTLVTVSEFGRAVAENGLGGTEHGDATAALVLGGGARRGRILGERRSLDAAGAVVPTTFLPELLARLA